jgi:hypothetical protein
MNFNRQNLREVLLIVSLQIVFTLIAWLLTGSSSIWINSMLAIPFSSLVMSLLAKKGKLPSNWIKYCICGVLMLVFSAVLYFIEEKFLSGFLSDALGYTITYIWQLFPGTLKPVAVILLFLWGLIVCAVFFALFLVLLLFSNLIFTSWVLPKFEELVDDK